MLKNVPRAVVEKIKDLHSIRLVLPAFLLVIALGLVLLVGSFLSVEGVTQVIPDYQLKPGKINTDVNSKVINVSTQSANIRIEENIVGSKALLNRIIITNKGDNLLVLINKKIQLPATYVPADLVSLVGSVSTVSGSALRKEAALALIDLINSAKASGLNLTIVSAYRSYSQQVAVFNGWVSSAGVKNAESFSAKAGHSQHQLGTAIDFGVEGKSYFNEAFGQTAEGQWLFQNAPTFGFVISYPKGKEAVTGYSYEPWHYRYIGKSNAQKMGSLGLILEEFLQRFGTW